MGYLQHNEINTSARIRLDLLDTNNNSSENVSLEAEWISGSEDRLFVTLGNNKHYYLNYLDLYKLTTFLNNVDMLRGAGNEEHNKCLT